MKISLDKIKFFILDALFPKFCLNCKSEGKYLCEDCLSLLDILENSYCLCEKPFRLPAAGKCKKCQNKKLNGLYFALYYQNNLVKKIIQRFKYEPFARELSNDLASLIITHLSLLNKTFDFGDFVLVPIPLYKKKLKWRGYNQAEELAKELSKSLKIPLLKDSLDRTKETLPQIELATEARKNNIKGAFSIKRSELLQKRKVLLVDDVYTTGATMEECARVLKESGAKEVWGIVVARD